MCVAYIDVSLCSIIKMLTIITFLFSHVFFSMFFPFEWSVHEVLKSVSIFANSGGCAVIFDTYSALLCSDFFFSLKCRQICVKIFSSRYFLLKPHKQCASIRNDELYGHIPKIIYCSMVYR